MNETFAHSAAHFAGLAAQALGWRPTDFWDATPAELALSLGPAGETGAPPTREDIRRMIEQERANGR